MALHSGPVCFTKYSTVQQNLQYSTAFSVLEQTVHKKPSSNNGELTVSRSRPLWI